MKKDRFGFQLYLDQASQTPYADPNEDSAVRDKRNIRFGKTIESYVLKERELSGAVKELESRRTAREDERSELESRLKEAQALLEKHRSEEGPRYVRAKNGIAQSALFLVANIARCYSRITGIPVEELTGYGNVGLAIAAEGFDWRRGTKFITYATWWVRQSILRGIQSENNQVYTPAFAHQIRAELEELEGRLKTEMGRGPDHEELYNAYTETRKPCPDSKGKRKNKTKFDSVRAVIVLRNCQILGNSNYKADEDPSQYILDYRTPELDQAETAHDLKVILTYLEQAPEIDERERQVLRCRFGLDGEKPNTHKEIGDALGLTKSRVQQIEAEALGKLRARFCPEPQRKAG